MPVDSSNLFLIIDGHSYAYRAFHAIRSLTSPAGRPTNAIYGFIKMLMKMRARLDPSHVVVVWDGGLSDKRLKLLPEYKAQRPSMPEDLECQIAEIKTYLTTAGLGVLCRDGVEADDWIGALALEATKREFETVIASSDKDFMQLVGYRVRLLNPNDKTEQLWSAEQVRVKTGVEPNQIVDWLSLVGDSVDNIGGVPGVGPKTATDLVRHFGSVPAIYARLSEVRSGRIRDALQLAKDVVLRNLKVIRLHEELPEPFDAGKYQLRDADVAGLRLLFESWGFKGLLKELELAQAAQPELDGWGT